MGRKKKVRGDANRVRKGKVEGKGRWKEREGGRKEKVEGKGM